VQPTDLECALGRPVEELQSTRIEDIIILFAQFCIHGKRINIIFTATDRIRNEKNKDSG
jgi:hypothetical protein